MPRASEPDPATPRGRSVACRKCGAPVTFDEAPDDDVVKCVECGAANLAPSEEV